MTSTQGLTSSENEARVFTGTRHNEGKTNFTLIEPDFMRELAETLTEGAKEHGVRNWMDIEGLESSALESLFRHVDAIRDGKLRSDDMKKTHAAHIASNAMFLHHVAILKEKGEYTNG